MYFVLFLFLSANAYYYYIADQCLYSSHDLSDMVYVQLYGFNRAVEIKYNSTLGKFMGFNEVGVNTSELWNQNANFLQQMKGQVDTYCKPNAQFLETVICDKAGKRSYLLFLNSCFYIQLYRTKLRFLVRNTKPLIWHYVPNGNIQCSKQPDLS